MSTRPVVGIITNIEHDANYSFAGYPRITQNEDYARSLTTAGAVPMLLPPTEALQVLPHQIARLDALVLAGGVDVDPLLYGEQPHRLCGVNSTVRDRYELAALELARTAGLPVLGICRGLQVCNVFAGGTLHQDISLTGSSQKHDGGANPDQPIHDLSIEPGSFLHQAWGVTSARTNSFHHQAINRLGEGLRPVAWASDGIIEAVQWHDQAKFPLTAVQWHPEMMTRTSEQARALFSWFVQRASS